jgi:protein TonB
VSPSYYLWKVERCPIRVLLSASVVDRLGATIEQAPQSSEPEDRKMEVGGLLLGYAEGGETVVIEDFREIPSEHRRGASFDFSPRDRRVLARELTVLGGRVVGYFRSHTRAGLYLDQGDNDIATEFFPGPSRVFLLVKPHAEGAPTAGFFVWEDGEIDRRQSPMTFPFDCSLLSPEEIPVRVPDAESERAKPPVVAYAWLPKAAGFLAGALCLPAITFLGASLWPRTHPQAHSAPVARVAMPAPADTEPEPAPTVPPPDVREPPPPIPARRAKPRVVHAPKPVEPFRPRPRLPVDQPVAIARTIPPPAAPIDPSVPLAAPPAKLPPLRTSPRVSFEPVHESAFHKTLRHINVISKLRHHADDFVPARPMKHQIPQNLAGDVDLKIHIESNGEVSETELLSRSAPPDMAEIARHAAARWDFEPARRGDKPVPSEMVVHIRVGHSN